MTTAAFDTFVAPARAGRRALWRLVLGVVLCAAIYVATSAALLTAFAALGESDSAMDRIGGLARPETPAVTLILFLTFVGMALGPMAAVRLLHGRPMHSLIGPDLRRALADFGHAVLRVGAVYAAGLAVWALVFDSQPNLSPGIWLLVLPLTLAGLLLQTGAEEVLFRGYLIQQLAARFRSPVAWALFPAAIFAVMHYDPSYGNANTTIVMLSAGLFGLIGVDLVRITGNLGAAWGFHFVNNTVAIALLATDGTITGLALRKTPYSADDARLLPWLMLADVAMMILAWMILRRSFRAASASG